MSLPPPKTTYLEIMEEFPLATINPERAWDCVLWALNDGFPFLTYPQIKNPPKEWLEAAMVRQLGLWIMIEKFGVPKKRTAAIACVSREVFWRAFPKIEMRLLKPKFKEHAERILADAIEKIEAAQKAQTQRDRSL